MQQSDLDGAFDGASDLTLSLRLDRTTLPTDGSTPDDRTRRHLVARVLVDAPTVRDGAGPDPLPPLDLALVIDASGSMAGAPLEAAKEAARQVARTLAPTDRLTVVSFGSDVVVHIDRAAMSAAGRSAAARAIDTIHPRGTTWLSSGWLTGCQALLDANRGGVLRRRHAIVLSDGHANGGIVDPRALAAESAALLERGIVSSAVGIGDGYSPVQLSAIAEHGGGSLHDAEDPTEILEVVLGEVTGLCELAAERVELELDLPDGVRATELTGAPLVQRDGRTVVTLGSLRHGVERRVALRLEIDDDLPLLELTGRVRWNAPGDPRRRTSDAHTVRAERSSQPAPPPSLDDATCVLTAWEAGLVRRVTELNRAGDFDAVRALRDAELPAFTAYAAHHPATRARVGGQVLLFLRAERPLRERTAKQMFDLSKKAARSEPIHYRRSKGGWFEQFDREA